MYVCAVCSVLQSHPTLCDLMDYSHPGSSVHGILQARIQERIAISSSRGSSLPRDQMRVSQSPALAGKFSVLVPPGKPQLCASVQFSHSVTCYSCDPMDCSTPGFPVHHQLPEFTQTHVHQVGDAIQPSHPLSFSSPPAFNLF